MNPVRVHVTDHHGLSHELEGLEGWRLMEVIRDYGLPVKAECGGACSCATCHVYVDEAWENAIVPPLEEEMAMLDEAFNVEENSRLSCQIILQTAHDGLKVTLAEGTQP